MLEKSVRMFYNVISVIVHISVIALIVSVPVLFAVKANAPLDFTVKALSVAPAGSGDEYLGSVGEAADGWYRIDYDMSVASGRFSPYGYTIEKFALIAPSDCRTDGVCRVAPVQPVEFTCSGSADFVLTVYYRAPSGEAAETFAKTAKYGTRSTYRNFSFIKDRISVYAPQFSMEDLLSEKAA